MRIRRANEGDAYNVAKVQVDSWRTTYKGIVADEFLNSLSYETRAEVWKSGIGEKFSFVAESEDGQIVGFIVGGKERSGKYDGYVGELYAIYLLKEYQKMGIGAHLVKALAEELLKNKMNNMLVFVLADNSAKYFYEKMGARLIDETQIQIGSQVLDELVYAWDDIHIITQ